LKPSNKSGFTLLEAVIALVLAASGLAMSYQGMGGAAKLQAATQEMNRTQMVAASVLASLNTSSSEQSGITDGIAWSVVVEPIARNGQGQELVRIRVLASGPSGREVQLVSEIMQSGNE